MRRESQPSRQVAEPCSLLYRAALAALFAVGSLLPVASQAAHAGGANPATNLAGPGAHAPNVSNSAQVPTPSNAPNAQPPSSTPLSPPPAAPVAPELSDAALAAEGPSADKAITQRLAVWRFDALGIAPELVTRLETLFRLELERLAVAPLTARRDLDRLVTGDLRECTGEERCLAAIGKRVNAEVIVTGTVGALGANYVLTIKAVDVATGKTLRRITSDPLQGQPDELIEAVRVAAYRLLAPDQIHGGIVLLTDLVGGVISLDGKVIGQTPLGKPLTGLSLGPHQLHIAAPGYQPFSETVAVRFQKHSRVVVRMVQNEATTQPAPTVAHRTRAPWYSRPWFIVGVGLVATSVGVLYARSQASTVVQCPGAAACQ